MKTRPTFEGKMIEFLRYYNQARFMAYVPAIRKNMHEWQLVEVSLTGTTSHNTGYIAKKLKDYFGDREGIIFICNSKVILAVVNMGTVTDSHHLASGIGDTLPKYSCSVEAAGITADGLLKFQVRLGEIEKASKAETPNSSLFGARLRRVDRIVMVADDDMFIRSLVRKTFLSKGKVIELDKAESIVDTYLEVLPDIVLLDIHLPGGSGIDILSEILRFDETAYVLMLSSDSVKDNVLSTQKLGAKGFIVKPFTQAKLEDIYNKCPTVAPWLASKTSS